VLPLVAAEGFAADVSQHLALCGTTWRRGDRGATNDMLVQSLRLQCGAREARAAGREEFVTPVPWGEVETFEGTTQLIRAAALNNLPRALQLIQLGAPLDAVGDNVNGFSYSALHWASRMGHELIVKALLDGKYKGRGAAVDSRSVSGWTPLSQASYEGHEAVARLLILSGAKQEHQDDEGYTALHNAVLNDHLGVVTLLCTSPGAAAAFVHETSDTDSAETPLAFAIERGRAACAAVLRAHGAPE
jgi:ankyrin repeat protein